MVHAAPDEVLPARPLRTNAPTGAVLWSPGERSQGAKGDPALEMVMMGVAWGEPLGGAMELEGSLLQHLHSLWSSRLPILHFPNPKSLW